MASIRTLTVKIEADVTGLKEALASLNRRLIPIAGEFVEELEAGWSRPLEHRIEDGELILREPIPPPTDPGKPTN